MCHRKFPQCDASALKTEVYKYILLILLQTFGVEIESISQNCFILKVFYSNQGFTILAPLWLTKKEMRLRTFSHAAISIRGIELLFEYKRMVHCSSQLSSNANCQYNVKRPRKLTGVMHYK